MAKSKPKIQKRLAKLVLAALLCTGGVQTFIGPSVAEAGGTVTLSGVDDNYYPPKYYITDPPESMTNYGYAYPIDTSVTTLNVTGGNYTTELGIIGAGYNADPTGRTVNVTGGTIQGLVAGAIGIGWDEGVEVSGNSVTVSGDETVVGKVAGGVAFSNGYYASDVLDNWVTIDGGQITGGVYGGHVKQDTYLPSGYDDYGDVTGNNLIINNGTFTLDSTSAMPRSGSADIAGGFTEKGNASNNHVTINNGTFRAPLTGSSITYSTIIISGGATLSGNATDNHVTINNGTFVTEDSATISGITISGGATSSGKANKNTVTINGGTFKSTNWPTMILGGGGTEEASNNTVTVNTSMDGVMIYGGRAFDTYNNVEGTAANNTVNILKPLNAIQLQGGEGDAATSTGNTLNIAAKDVTAGWVNYFQNMNFTLPSDIANNDTMLTVYNGSTNLTGVTFGMKNAENVNLNPGDVINVFVSENGLSGDFTEKNYELAFDVNVTDNLNFKGTQGGVLKKDGNTKLIYTVGKKDVNTINIGAVKWQKDATLFDGSDAGYNYANVTELGTENFAVTYDKPETVAANDSMTLLKANETLQEMAEQTKSTSYTCSPVSGVTIDASIIGKLAASDGKVTFTAAENKASKLTFGDVEWKDSGALLTRPANITFAGADVDTAKINFHNIQELAANSRMTLVSDFGETVGTITGDTFTVGSGLQGEGAASLSGTDLVFTAKTGAESLTPTEATHETVMAMEAGTAVVAAGREYVDSAVEGLGLVSNMAPDGTSTFASMGGGVGRYKTGSHVDTHTWNAVVAVGSKREHKKGSLEWGVFAEYGRGNYTLHDDNGGRGDGNTHYAGGGLLAKWTNKHDVYTEASFRMGRMSDSASNMLRDVLGNTYGYDVHANYFGGHVGLGKIYKVKGNKDLDVYGKFFYTRRNGVDFDAGGNHYSLDSVASKLLRIGARYGSNDRKWNWYGGLAYEYEFGGESRGTVDGLAIRSASIKGASVRGEIGVRLEATKTNPWKADISIYGYGGKHRGIGGTVSVAYMF
jgi:hypothetical protein